MILLSQQTGALWRKRNSVYSPLETIFTVMHDSIAEWQSKAQGTTWELD